MSDPFEEDLSSSAVNKFPARRSHNNLNNGDGKGSGGCRQREGSRSVRVNLMLSAPRKHMLAPPVQGKRRFKETHHRIPPDPRKDVTLEVGQ